jgi:hypothetical protein
MLITNWHIKNYNNEVFMSLFSPTNSFSLSSTHADQIYWADFHIARINDRTVQGCFDNALDGFGSLEKTQINAKTIIHNVTHQKKVMGAKGEFVTDKVLHKELTDLGCSLSRIASKVSTRNQFVKYDFDLKPRTKKQIARFQAIKQSFDSAYANLQNLGNQMLTLSEVIKERSKSSSAVQDESIDTIGQIKEDVRQSREKVRSDREGIIDLIGSEKLFSKEVKSPLLSKREE